MTPRSCSRASIAFAVALQIAVIYLPALQRAFGTTALGADDWALTVAVASTIVIARELLKAAFRRADRRAGLEPPSAQAA